jgi:polyvinyl alcohol dehydrogenase (cytochrome)
MKGVCLRTLTRMLLRTRHHGIALVALAATVVLTTVHPSPGAAADWPMFGQDASNAANQSSESIISTSNAGSLAKKWSYTTHGDVSARAAVVNGVAYFPDWGGYLHAVNTATGGAVWSKPVSAFGVPSAFGPPPVARTTPAVVKGRLYIGTQDGAWLLAIDAATGNLIWKTQLESPANDPFAIISASPVVVGGTVFTGVASIEEAIAANPLYAACCKARGSVVAVNANTGAIKWKTYTVPADYNGGGVWGSNPVVDGGTVFVGTGNNYTKPKDNAASSIPGVTYGACIAGGGTAATCNAADNYIDSILALDVGNGKIRWGRKLLTWDQGLYGVTDGSDNWNVACLTPPFTNCPANAGPDYDFGSGPNLITYQTANGPKTILGAGQKSGIYYALDPKTGATLWQTQVGPGSALGGMEWGSATDGQRVYVQIANFYGIPWLTPSGGLGGFAGLWAALDPATGTILWQTADPNGAVDIGPMTVANGVVYAASMGGPAFVVPGPSTTAPTMFALDAATGSQLWSYVAGSSVNAGATVVNGVVYWGSGYAHLGIPGFTGNTQFSAFSLGGL